MASVKARQRIEKVVVRQVLRDALVAGYALSVDNGGDDDELPPTTDYSTINNALFATDQDDLYLWKGAQRFGVINFVYGNDGWDVIANYSINIEEVLEQNAFRLSDKYMPL